LLQYNIHSTVQLSLLNYYVRKDKVKSFGYTTYRDLVSGHKTFKFIVLNCKYELVPDAVVWLQPINCESRAVKKQLRARFILYKKIKLKI